MGSGILPETIVSEHNPPCHLPLLAETLQCKEEAISKQDPQAQAFSLGQGSFKMECGKMEDCSVVRRVTIQSSFWKCGTPCHPDQRGQGQPKLLSTLSSEACISDGMGFHECVWHGQLACLERHHQCRKIYSGSRTTYAPIQTSSLSGKTLYFSTR